MRNNFDPMLKVKLTIVFLLAVIFLSPAASLACPG
jgi:hypothetical protein